LSASNAPAAVQSAILIPRASLRQSTRLKAGSTLKTPNNGWEHVMLLSKPDRRSSRERYIPTKAVNADRIERWLGAEKVAKLQADMRGWYGDPIVLRDVPGSVWITKDGDFVGEFSRGYFMSAMDSLEEFARRFWRESGRPQYGVANAGFSSISDALSRATRGFGQDRFFNKAGPTGVSGVSSSLWRVGNQPAAGSAPAAAPGGTAFSSSTTGALVFANPAAGTNRLVGADASCNQNNYSLLMYDLIFGVNKTMASTATEAVTGVPTRYQSTTATDEDYAGSNFLFVQVGGTALAATAHNWTTCTYTDQSGNTGATLPSLTGNSAAIVDRYDHPTGQWFAPLASDDTGIKALTQMQCSASVATGVVWFMMGHPLGIMTMYTANIPTPYDWLTNKRQAPRIFDDACVAFIEPTKISATAGTFNGYVQTTSTSA
jgi:hypothetical protein